jgi:polyhydroxybutyrate depolymerase
MTFRISRICLAWLASLLFLWSPIVARTSAALAPLRITVDGANREAMIYIPSGPTNGLPVVFVFHGHGGTARHAARTFGLHDVWREAIVIYPQGLPTPGQLTDAEGRRAGWQGAKGRQDDRDLKFFDALLATVKAKYPVDSKRVYATGHSNGGGFTYLLWAERGESLAAVAPSAAAAPFAAQLQPKPALHLGGRNDPLVKFAWQERTMETVRQINGCEREGQPWKRLGTIYSSTKGAPLVTVIHSGGHELNRDAGRIIATFFQAFPAGPDFDTNAVAPGKPLRP